MTASRWICCCLIAAAAAISNLFASATGPAAQDSAWKDEHGKPAPDTEFRKSKEGFGGWLVVTPDADWREKWDTSPETVPHFNTASTVERGKKITILIFFINPTVDAKNTVDVTCDIQSIRPDGGISIDQRDLPCLKGALKGSPTNIRLAEPVIKFVGDPKDLAGEWIIKVTVRDNHRHVELALKTSFTLK